MKRNKQVLAVTLATSLVVGSLGVGQMTVQAETGAQNATIELTDADVAELSGVTSVTRTSVHDPSIVKAGDTYYIFGSHMGVSKTTDLQNWTNVTGESTTSSLFGVEKDGVATVASYEQAFLQNVYTGKVTALVNGEEVEVDFGENYDIAAWISDNTIQGNMWAPDVIYNPTMDKWCMYQSLNGATWNSAVVLLTADKIEGPYVYQGPVVFSGFSTTDSSKSFKNTDLEIVIGEQDELPEKYQKISDKSWGEYWPHAIDPAAFYDDEGDLWLTYGSWSGGIYMLELDENSGLRDYTVSYESDYDTLGKSVTSDEYFGKKIAGGYYVSGEGPYIEKIEDYYYLFMSYGFYSPEGGYNMRVFRSENPDGPYVDANGVSAIYQKYVHNYNAMDKYNNYGVKLMGNYQWDTMKKAEVAQGHNSAFVDDDGKAYVVYHTKFNDGTAGHEVRVHQLYVNSQGWLVASPYEYSGETISATGYSAEEIAGTYGMITHEYQINFGDLEYQSPETIVLNADGTVSGAYTGTWSTTAGSSDATLVLDGKTYYGMFTEEVIDGTTIETMGFTFVSTDGLSIWGTKELGDSIAVAQTVSAGVQIPTTVYESFTLPTEGQSDAKIAWTSSNEAVISTTGVVTRPSADTIVTMTATVYKGDYFYQKEFSVLVKAAVETDTEKVIATYLTGESKNLSTGLNQSISIQNPFHKNVTAVDLSGGVTVAFDAVATGDVHVLGTIFSFLADGGANGRLYFTPGSYLGYNANGGYFDANLLNYGLVTDYIGESAHVEINIHDAGFAVTVDGDVAYTEEILTTENGAGTVTNYKTVLNWLQNSADTLYFGYGSWWNAAGYDEANVEISNVEFKVGAAKEASEEDEIPTKTSAEYTKDEVVLTSNDSITIEENPFYGVDAEKVELAYTINFTEGTAQNGWDGIFSFYNSTTGGRVSVQTAPYVCYNDGAENWMDINKPGLTGGSNMAPSAVPGQDYDVVITITADGMTATVNGEEVTLAIAGSGAGYDDILAFLGECDQLTWGVGLAQTAYWNTELCTLTDIEIVANGDFSGVETPDEDESKEDDSTEETGRPETFADATYEKNEVVLASNDAMTVEDSPFYGLDTDKVKLEYTITFAEGSAHNGFDGIFSFYNSETTGRVSIQTAPYVCYNDAAGNWMDINHPDSTNGSNMATNATVGESYKVTILITEEGVEATVNGEVVALGLSGSGAGYDELLAFIGDCDQLTWGVGQAKTSYWFTELCTLTDVKFTAGNDVVVDIPDEDVPSTETPDGEESSSTEESSSDEESSSTEESSSDEESSSEEESSTEEPSKPSKEPEKKPSSNSSQSNSNQNNNNQSQSSSKPVVKKVEIVEIIEEIVPKASSIEKVGFNYVDIKLNQKNAKLKKEFLAKYYGRNTQLMVHLGNKVGFSIDTAQLSANQEELAIGATVKSLDTFAEGFVTMHIQPTKAATLNQMIGIHLNAGKEYAGKSAFIYARDLTTNTIEFQYAATVNEIGNVTLLSDELTDVVVMIQE